MDGNHGEDDGTLPVTVSVRYAFVGPTGKEYHVYSKHIPTPVPKNGGRGNYMEAMLESLESGNKRCIGLLGKMIILAERGNWEENPFVMALEELDLAKLG